MNSRMLLAAADPKSLAWIPAYEFVGMLLTLAVVIAVGVWVRVRAAHAARQLADEPILDTPSTKRQRRLSPSTAPLAARPSRRRQS